MDEKTFYESDNIKVTSVRFIVNNQTYALSSVNSVRVSEVDTISSYTAPALIAAGGIVWVLFLIAFKGLPIYYLQPIALMVAGIYLLTRIKKNSEYRVVLTTSSGENAVLRSNEKQEIILVEKALNDAIVYRG
jgi:hypothetical protein